MKSRFLTTLLGLLPGILFAKTLHVGKGQPFESIAIAARSAAPGDSILVHNGTYRGGQSLDNLKGAAGKWIYIIAEKQGEAIIEGGHASVQGNDLAYVQFESLTFTKQTDNGANFSDGATYETPSHHLTFKNCTFKDIAATGNNDLLKLSGVDEFTLTGCTFLNGSKGGSGVDMVGCHKGLITQCRFENMGSNAIQMKGGTSDMRVERCLFKNAGERAINLGGSTGLPFFRPMDVKWEAADLKVYSNVFIGGEVPVAFVGCTRSEVVNNTIYKPNHWVLRILQENKDTTRFVKSGHNTFANNVIVIDQRVRVICNIGGDTAPQTFTFTNNAWCNVDAPNWSATQLPVIEKNAMFGKDPSFGDAVKEDFSIGKDSPLIGAGSKVSQPEKDFDNRPFKAKRAIGAFEVK
ncbi:right-handed parallel beta-helix repeat-containing protein [Mucilaginibacter myungsuensis]|uniref:Right-handed parallel beta-helix repeat-containing protein n=1 Tax=Mucilaginibacter myungsuensis TaxID=649104 RepID=A0A929L6J1_9SPHI|nr:right-handed parallel beta-helix repeat-containing protein [Mucilaginibacter myungsuensis]MBE9664111.1 right-handed parallel beta-helix repeat-containing protein [Mucilaginibacter myungsuensis]MDN3601290.1 right-handed parallel beta-helix repeat-containing protein [Mucilaginibacter myungsuensis]